MTSNETELEVLSDMPGAPLEAAARSLLTTDQQTTVVTVGARGAQYVQRGSSARVSSFRAKTCANNSPWGADHARAGSWRFQAAYRSDAVWCAGISRALVHNRLGSPMAAQRSNPN